MMPACAAADVAEDAAAKATTAAAVADTMAVTGAEGGNFPIGGRTTTARSDDVGLNAVE